MAWLRLVAHHELRRFENAFERLDAHDAVLAKKRIRDFVRTGQRAGVRVRNGAPDTRAAELEGDDRLARFISTPRGLSVARRSRKTFCRLWLGTWKRLAFA